MVNKVLLLGNLGKDPETVSTKTGTSLVKFSLATTSSYKGEKQTEWHNIVVFGKSAENCAKYLAKGSTVYIEGRLQTSKWEDKDKKVHYSTGIIAETVTFLSKPKEKESSDVPPDWNS